MEERRSDSPAGAPAVRRHILVADGEGGEARRLARQLEGIGYEVTTVPDDEGAWNLLEAREVSALVAELRGTRVDGLRLLGVARARNPELCVVLIAGPDQLDLATRALALGIDDYQTRPIITDRLLATLRRAEDLWALRAEIGELHRRLDRKYGIHNIIGNSAAVSSLLAKILEVAPTDASVLITGETGTGKELVAAAIHQNSRRRQEPFVRLHCGDLAAGLVESELFGHERGAFTGAVDTRRGRFELANGGTLFLDGVGELAVDTQAKLLRVLEDGEIRRVGAERAAKVDVRVVAATHRNLLQSVDAGTFREDLYYRLNVVGIELPPLRFRTQDIPLLADHFLREAAQSAGKPVAGLSQRVMSRLVRYAWPGNIRELKNVITGMVVSAEGGGALEVDDLPPAIKALPDEGQGIWVPLGTPMEEIERRVIEATLASVGADINRASSILGISRRTLFRRLSSYKHI